MNYYYLIGYHFRHFSLVSPISPLSLFALFAPFTLPLPVFS